jgi:hypothetical protein
LLFLLFKELAVPDLQKAFFFAAQKACCSGCSAMLTGFSVLVVRIASFSGCSEILLFWLSRKLAVSAAKKASCCGCSESLLLWLPIQKASRSGYSESFPFWLSCKHEFLLFLESL